MKKQKKLIDDVVVMLLLIGLLFFIIGFIGLFFEPVGGFFTLLFGSIFLLPYYWLNFYKPKMQKRELEERKRRNQEEIRIKYGDLFLNVVDAIGTFKPLFVGYYHELSYHIDLTRWLEPKFPILRVEQQIGSARPDIVIEDIAIEIKGPTTEEGLQSIADKCLRYHHHFKKMIVVLFDVQTKTSRFFNEWEEGMKKNFPDVVVIKK